MPSSGSSPWGGSGYGSYSPSSGGAGYATPGSGSSTLPSSSSPGVGSRPSAPDANVTPASYPSTGFGG